MTIALVALAVALAIVNPLTSRVYVVAAVTGMAVMAGYVSHAWIVL